MADEAARLAALRDLAILGKREQRAAGVTFSSDGGSDAHAGDDFDLHDLRGHHVRLAYPTPPFHEPAAA